MSRPVRTSPSPVPAPSSVPAPSPVPAARRAARPVLFALLALLTLAACSSTVTLSAVPPVPAREPLVDITNYDIAVDIQHEAGLVDGHVDVSFTALPGKPARTLELDAAEMEILSISDDRGRELTSSLDGQRLTIELGQELAPGQNAVVGINYRAYPRRGMYFVAPDTGHPGRPWQIWTQGQVCDTRYWVPVWDQPNDRATHKLAITVDDHFMTLAAGTRTSSIEHSRLGRRTDTWEMTTPHSSYLITLIAGELGEIDLGNGEVPLPVVAEPADLERAAANFAATADILAFFGQATGRPYPYPKYAQICVREFTAGGMENISATTLTQGTLHDPRDEPQADSVDLIAHEAAHQWFGDLLTCRDWGDTWLNEGFATYYEVLYQGHLEGTDRQRVLMLGNEHAIVRAELAHSHPISRMDYDDPDEMFDDHSYPGGATRLNLLSELLGRDAFTRGIARYVADHEAGLVTTEDLRRSMEDATGVPLQRFFDEWIYGTGFPKFRVGIDPAQPADRGRREQPEQLRIEQTQRDDGWREVFHLPVTVSWSRGGVEHEARLDIDERVEVLPLAGQGALDWVRFDSTTVVPGEIDTLQDESMWRNQMLHAHDAVTRMVAAQWFSGSAWMPRHTPDDWELDEASIDALVQVAHSDPFRDVRGVAVRALSHSHDDRAAPALVAALSDPDAIVRAAAARGLADVGGDEVLPDLTSAADDPNGSVVAGALRSLADRGYPGAFTMCASRFAEDPRVRLKRDIVGVVAGIEDEPRVLPFLLGVAAHGEDERVRVAAINGLGGQPDPQDVVFRRLSGWLDDSSYRVRSAVARALGRTEDPRAAIRLRARADVEAEGSVLRALEQALNAIP